MSRLETTETQNIQTPNSPLAPPGYAQPISQPAIAPAIPVTPVAIISNQNNPNGNALPVDPDKFKCVPIMMECQFCHRMMATKVSKSLNVCACLLCYCTGIVCYVLIQACRKKDICCWDATHKCPFCGNTVGAYNSC